MPGHQNGHSFATSGVEPQGGPPASTFSWSVLTCKFIVFIVWVITPISWIFVFWTILGSRSSIPFHSSNTTVFRTTFKNILFQLLFLYALCEVCFSIYYRYLIYKVQKRTPLPIYSRSFLRQTLARALEDGMKEESQEAIDTSVKKDTAQTAGLARAGRPRRPTFSRANFSQLSFLDSSKRLSSDDPRAIEWREMFRAWFLGTPWEQLKRENVLEWLSWSFFGMHYEELVNEWEKEGCPAIPKDVHTADDVLTETSSDEQAAAKLGFIYHGLYMLEARSAMPLPEGRNSRVSSMRLHLDPVKITSRPLAKYLVTGFFNKMLERRTRSAGFVRETTGGLEYLIRMPKNWKAGEEKTRPILFIHGLGMGLAQYASIVSYFEQHPTLQDRPLVLLIQPHLSMDLFHPEHLRPPNKTGTTQGLRAIVKKWGFHDGLTVVSHSNGTIVHGWLLKDCPDLVKASCLVDPVTFCLWEPFVAYNFLYRKPQTGIDILMRYFVGEEIGIALMLQRYFDWSANILWFEEIPQALDKQQTAFFVAESDAILNAPRVVRYLRDHGVKFAEDGGNLYYMRGLAHGEALITGGDYVKIIMDWLSSTA